MQGIGGLEATIDETTGTVTPVVTNAFGDVVGWISAGFMNWNPAQVGSYGALPGSTAAVFDGGGATLAQSMLWRSRRIDPTGFYYMGARYYEPVSGRFISPDPLGHASSMGLYDYANGDPVNGLDPDGRCVEGFKSGWNGSVSSNAPNSLAFRIGSVVGAATSGFSNGWGNAAEISLNTVSLGYTDSHGITNSSQYQGWEYDFSRTASGIGWASAGAAVVLATGGAALEASPSAYVGLTNFMNSPVGYTVAGGVLTAGYVKMDGGTWTDAAASGLFQMGMSYASNPGAFSLPQYNGKTTQGILLTTNGDMVALTSGGNAYPQYSNYVAANHVEGQAALYIRATNATGGMVIINNPNGICGYCNRMISTLLPQNTTLTVMPPANAVPNNPQAVAVPTTFTGNSNIPKVNGGN